MRISDLILALIEVSNKHGDLLVTGHLTEETVRKVTPLTENGMEFEEEHGAGNPATEVFLE